MLTTMTKPAAAEIPADAPQPVLKPNIKTARVRISRDVWPNFKLTKGDRLYRGQVVAIPIEDAKSMIAYQQAVLVFDEPGDNEGVK